MNVTTIPEGAVLTQRHLNRALLARQHLLERSSMPAEDMISRLIGMQSQVPNDPYIGLWTRLASFTPDDLSRMMLDRTALRASLMRGTIHLVTVDDYLRLFPVMFALHQRVYPATDSGKRLDPAHIPDVLAEGRDVLRQAPVTVKQLGDHLSERWPDRDARAMAQAIRFLLPLVQTTPRGVWGASHQATWALAEDWLGASIPDQGDPAAIIRRYLAAFGPATVADMQAWSGLTGLRAVVETMSPELRVFRNERGQELLDVPGALLPDPETPAPVRFLPGFENALLSHKDRTRIISEERRRAIGSRNGLFLATYLVDGFVAGVWAIEQETDTATLVLKPFEPHPREVLRELEEEGRRLVSFATGVKDSCFVVEPFG